MRGRRETDRQRKREGVGQGWWGGGGVKEKKEKITRKQTKLILTKQMSGRQTGW